MFEIKMLTLLSVLLGVCLLCPHLVEARSNSNLDAWIETSKMEDGSLMIRPMCLAQSKMMVEYFLTVIKEGPTGMSLSSQSGRASLSPQIEKILCELSLGLEPKSTCRLRLEISRQGKVVIAKEFVIEETTFTGPT